MLVPSSANLSIRRSIAEVGTGGECLSNSLQYVQARLQRRIGMICAKIGWSGDAIARANILASRQRRLKLTKVFMPGGKECPYLSLYAKSVSTSFDTGSCCLASKLCNEIRTTRQLAFVRSPPCLWSNRPGGQSLRTAIPAFS